MLSALMLGSFAGWVVALPYGLALFFQKYFPSFSLPVPVAVLGFTGLAMLLQRFIIDRNPGDRDYDGLADLFIHIHSVSSPDPVSRWSLRGMNSFFLSLVGLLVGLEGAAAEWAHALAIRTRVRTSIRFEQRRRSDASIALASAFSAAFGAPFAGVIIPMEMGIGGPLLPVILGALISNLWIQLLNIPVIPDGFSGFRDAFNGFYFNWQEWAGVLVIALLSGVVSTLLIRSIRGIQQNLFDLFGSRFWMRTLTAGLLLFSLVLAYKGQSLNPRVIAEKIFWYHLTGYELAVLFVVLSFALALILSGFGTIGIFWPVFVLGGVFGIGVNQWFLHDLPNFAVAAGMVGGAAFFGGTLGTPLAGAVLVYEMTGSFAALFLCLIAGYSARMVVNFLKTNGLIDRSLESRGVVLIDGRSAQILDSIPVKEALISDYESVFEYDSIKELHAKFLKSRYPFMPVLGPQGQYQGLLTVDMMQEAWSMQKKTAQSNPGLSRLIEAKDLLYRVGYKTPSVRISDKLSSASGLFESTPCVPVVTEDNRVVGLLFVYNVRLAYEREVARRSLELEKRSR